MAWPAQPRSRLLAVHDLPPTGMHRQGLPTDCRMLLNDFDSNSTNTGDMKCHAANNPQLTLAQLAKIEISCMQLLGRL